jgi:hypothetical protein
VATKVERYRQLYGRRHDDLLAQVVPAGEAHDRATHSGQLSEADLRIIVDAAAHERVLVAMNAVELLQAMSARWPAVISRSITGLFSSKHAHSRFAALCALTKHIDDSVICEVLRLGLRDKSARVRWKASNRAERLERRDLLPELEQAFAAETNAKTRRTIELHLKMLRDGYVRKDEADGAINLWVRTAQGATGCYVDPQVMREKGIDAVVAEIRQEKDKAFAAWLATQKTRGV